MTPNEKVANELNRKIAERIRISVEKKLNKALGHNNGAEYAKRIQEITDELVKSVDPDLELSGIERAEIYFQATNVVRETIKETRNALVEKYMEDIANQATHKFYQDAEDGVGSFTLNPKGVDK